MLTNDTRHTCSRGAIPRCQYSNSFTTSPYLRGIGLKEAVVVGIASARRRLKAVHVVTPPGAGSPPESTLPDVRVSLEVIKEAGDSSLADRVGTTGELAEDTLLSVGAEPGGGTNDTLNTNLSGNAGGAGTGAVRVKILVHLVDDLVLRVGKGDHVGVGHVPGPGARPLVTLDENVLGSGTGGTDTVDGGLVEVEDKGLVHGVVLVVGIEDDLGVGDELGSNVLPESLEGVGISDDVAIVAAIIMGIENDIGTGVGDRVDNLGEVGKIAVVERRSQGVGDKTLHGEANTEDVVTLAAESLKCEEGLV